MEIAIISGKGGTGKSTICAAFASLKQGTLLADCDVDAANMHILFTPEIESEEVFTGAETAVIDYSKCTNCGICLSYCRFDAISFNNSKIEISPVFCDGCRLCTRVCPENAIQMVESNASRLYTANYRYGKMVYGLLAPGEENSGRLVNLVRDKAKNIAKDMGYDNIVIDGPPGIGCPVISTITGVDHVIVVAEPTQSGLHDLKRTLEMTQQFNLKSWVLINKSDLNETVSDEVQIFCDSVGVEILAKIPFDEKVVESMVNCLTIPEYMQGSQVHDMLQSALIKILEYEE